MKLLGGTLFCLAVVMWVSWGLGNWFLERDTRAVLERAQVAANADDMKEYMQILQKNMEDRGMTKGHAAVIFKTPQNDMGLIYKTVVRINERLESIKDIPQTETTYQVALDDLRGTTRELDLFNGQWFYAHNWVWIVVSIIIGVFGVIFVLVGLEE